MTAIEKAFSLVADELARVESIMLEQFQVNSIQAIETVGAHIIKNGGKRLRPLLLLLSGRALGCDHDNLTHLACVIELIHTATLLHDDVIDLSPLRRNQLTAHEIWGNRTSILVGDFMFTRALELTSLYADKNWDITTLLAQALNGITVGEVLQLKHHNNADLSEGIYLEIIERKTAFLFAAACEMAALLAKRDDRREALRDYGLNLGIAFQLIDDLLDYESDEETLGKSLGDDLQEGKATLPFIHAYNHSQDRESLHKALNEGGKSSLEAILETMRKEGSIDYTRRMAAAYADRALSALIPLEDSPEKNALIDIAQYTIERHH